MHITVRGTVQTGQESLDYAISDLVLLQSGSSASVFATSGPNGGVSSYQLSEAGTARFVGSALYNPGWASGISSDIALIDDGYGSAWLIFGQVSSTGLGSIPVGPNGTLGSFEELSGLSPGLDLPGALGAMDNTHVLVGTGMDGFASYTLTGNSLDLDFALTDNDAALISSVSTFASVTVNEHQILIVSSTSEDGITSYEITDSGPVLADVNGPDQGLGIMHPTAMETITFGNTHYLLVASAEGESGAISVFEIAADGTLTATDHVLDTRDTRFGGIQDIAVVTHGDFTYVLAGGGDDGVSLFQLLQNGRLQYLDSIADTLTTGLSEISALAATAIGNTLRLLVGSQSEGMLTDLAVDLSGEGIQHSATPFGGVLNGTGKDDTLIGAEGDDHLFGGNGADILFDGAGQDQLTGGDGADIFVFCDDGTDDTILDFDPTKDLLDLSGWPMFHDPDSLIISTTATGAIVTWRDETLTIVSTDHQSLSADEIPTAILQGIDRPLDLTNITVPDDGEYDLTGTDGDDTLRGGPEDEVIVPGLGDDTVWAGSGNDLVFGGAGSNEFHLEDGDDTYDDRGASDPADGDTIYGDNGNDQITTGKGSDTVFGGDDDDVIKTGQGNDAVIGNRGADWIDGGDGNDHLLGGAGRDYIYGGPGDDTLEGLRGRDHIFGGAGNDILNGGRGRDYMFGGPGNDILSGGNGNDRIRGNTGDDILRGNAGDDRLRGGWGADTFIFAQGDGDDTIYDFQPNRDTIELEGINAGAVSLATIHDGILLSWDDGSVLLLGISADQFSISEIHYI